MTSPCSRAHADEPVVDSSAYRSSSASDHLVVGACRQPGQRAEVLGGLVAHLGERVGAERLHPLGQAGEQRSHRGVGEFELTQQALGLFVAGVGRRPWRRCSPRRCRNRQHTVELARSPRRRRRRRRRRAPRLDGPDAAVRRTMPRGVSTRRRLLHGVGERSRPSSDSKTSATLQRGSSVGCSTAVMRLPCSIRLAILSEGRAAAPLTVALRSVTRTARTYARLGGRSRSRAFVEAHRGVLSASTYSMACSTPRRRASRVRRGSAACRARAR